MLECDLEIDSVLAQSFGRVRLAGGGSPLGREAHGVGERGQQHLAQRNVIERSVPCMLPGSVFGGTNEGVPSLKWPGRFDRTYVADSRPPAYSSSYQ